MRSFYVKFIILFVAAGLLIFLVRSNISWLASHYEFVRTTRVAIFSKMSNLSIFISGLDNINNLTKENLFLKYENTKLLSQLAFQSELKKQNDFLRETTGLEIPTEYKLIDARMFNIQFTPLGHYALINKGQESNILKDDIVITSSGVLVGRIDEVSSGFSRIELITNRDLKITVVILDKSITAISRGNLGNGLQLDFISQNDDVANNDILVTHGNDLFPSGLIVGSVISVGPSDGNLFREVVAKSEFQNITLDRILILSK